MNVPEKIFESGSISATLWPRIEEIEGGITLKFYSINISKYHKDDDQGECKYNFSTKDLPNVVLVANEAYRYIALSTSNPHTKIEP